MWWPVIVLILLSYYYMFVPASASTVEKPTIAEPMAIPFRYTFESDPNGRLEFKTSRGKVWQFNLNNSYYFHNGQIYPKDECFGKSNGSFVKAQGPSLYRFIQSKKINPSMSGQFKTHVQGALQQGHLFYFVCKDDRIDSLSTCPPGEIFNENSCIAIDPCTNQPNGTTFEDTFDRQFYFSCPEGRLKCPPGTFFLHDACRSESSLEHACLNDPAFTSTINLTTFFSCVQGKPRVYTCPKGYIVLNNQCTSDVCYNQPDGSKIPFPQSSVKPFWFSKGYYLCKGNKISELVECPRDWDWYDSKGDMLLFLPQVFSRGQCTIPEYCENVTSEESDTWVQSYDFMKIVKNWGNSLLFDRSVGYKCDAQGRKMRVKVDPGQHIYNFHTTSACEPYRRHVVLADRIDAYFDCDQNAIVSCPIKEFFDGSVCRPYMKNPHRYKHMDIFTLDNLDFGWMTPWNYSKDANVESTCQDPESIYINGYNVCAHPDCQSFAFLKQLKAFIQLDETSKCVFKSGKITKVKTPRKKNFRFWTQRKSYQPEQCHPGSKVKSGHFLLDSVLYVTCDANQPFVFCPSPATIRIEQIDNVYACVPRDNVFQGTLQAFEARTFLDNHLARIVPTPGSKLLINGVSKIYGTNGIDINGQYVTIWSDKDVHLQFKMLVNHPPQSYFEEGQLKAYKDPNRVFVTRYKGGNTTRPIDFCSYNVKDAVTDFIANAT